VPKDEGAAPVLEDRALLHDTDAYATALEAWMDAHADELEAFRARHPGSLEDAFAHEARFLALLADAGWSRYGWPEDVGDLGGSATLRGVLYDELARKGYVIPEAYLAFEVLAPMLKVASVENGSLWVPYVTKAMDKMKGMGRNGPWPGGRVDGRPSEIFQQHVYVSPYHEEDIPALMDLIGPHRVLFGSDYPHPEGLAQPGEYAELIASRPADEIRLVMHDNAARLVGAA
jgi:Amidohydrolase/Acyl-CoA dehydrogenase, N-terminal domain